MSDHAHSALDALLKEAVERAEYDQSCLFSEGLGSEGSETDVPRLAAIVRVLREALSELAPAADAMFDWYAASEGGCPIATSTNLLGGIGKARAAFFRAETIARGKE